MLEKQRVLIGRLVGCTVCLINKVKGGKSEARIAVITAITYLWMSLLSSLGFIYYVYSFATALFFLKEYVLHSLYSHRYRKKISNISCQKINLQTRKNN